MIFRTVHTTVDMRLPSMPMGWTMAGLLLRVPNDARLFFTTLLLLRVPCKPKAWAQHIVAKMRVVGTFMVVDDIRQVVYDYNAMLVIAKQNKKL